MKKLLVLAATFSLFALPLTAGENDNGYRGGKNIGIGVGVGVGKASANSDASASINNDDGDYYSWSIGAASINQTGTCQDGTSLTAGAFGAGASATFGGLEEICNAMRIQKRTCENAKALENSNVPEAQLLKELCVKQMVAVATMSAELNDATAIPEEEAAIIPPKDGPVAMVFEVDAPKE